MKIAIAYPPLNAKKGAPLLSQNRQFQYFKEPTYIYPVVPAQAATLLKKAGHEVFWIDGIAEGISYEDFLKRVNYISPKLKIQTKFIQLRYEGYDPDTNIVFTDKELTTCQFEDLL